jgi:hypothetical protein
MLRCCDLLSELIRRNLSSTLLEPGGARAQAPAATFDRTDPCAASRGPTQALRQGCAKIRSPGEITLVSARRSSRSTCPLQLIVNLAELGGREGPLSHAYNQQVTEWNSPDVGYPRRLFRTKSRSSDPVSGSYCDYDFHAETKGMK